MQSRPNTSLALEISGLSHVYRSGFLRHKHEALHGLDLQIESGCRMGLAGPNGSGKTTLLQLVAGIERIQTGELAVLGGSPQSQRVRSQLGSLPEDSAFPDELSGRATLELCGSLRGMSGKELREQARTRLEQVGLGRAAKQRLRGYSRGMLRRFALAQTLLHRPSLVLMDEPTAGLDAEGYSVLEEVMAELRERNATVIMTSHATADLEAHCDRLCVLVHGHLLAEGPTGDLLAEPGQARLDFADLNPGQHASLEQEVQRMGGRILASGPRPGSLAQLYRRLKQAPNAEAPVETSAKTNANGKRA